jgi:hypothetical protein
MTYVYRHRKADTHEVFYVGIGSMHRSQSKHGRNKFWKRITAKHGFYSEVIAECQTKELACELEILLIEEYGRINIGTGILCNLTEGGEGVIGLSDEAKKSISNKLKEYYKANPITNRVISEEQKRKFSIAASKRVGDKNAFYGKSHTQEAKDKVSKANKGRVHSEEARAKIAEASRKMWQERKNKMK